MRAAGSNGKIILRLDPAQLCAWHLRLVERIEARHQGPVGIVWGTSQIPSPSSTNLMFELERLSHLIPSLGMVQPITSTGMISRVTELPKDFLLIDFCGERQASKSFNENPSVWRITYNGASGEGAKLNALLAGLPPRIEVECAGVTLASAQPGVENPGILLSAMNDVAARTISLILAALAGNLSTRTEPHIQEPVKKAPLPTQILSVIMHGLARAVAVRLLHLCFNTPHWRVGWRIAADFDFIETGRHPANGWTVIPDDGKRFYADPFPVTKGGDRHVFVEDFSHQEGFGQISVFKFESDGTAGPARPVLNVGSHLSYPFVFEAENEMWMIPESSTSRNLTLYRATNYPEKWTQEATLLSDVEISDATVFQHNDQWWMMATVRDEGGSYSDMLNIWTAPNFRGPWVPLGANPVLIDSAHARPAGAVFRHKGKLLRPVQDCKRYYGKSVNMMEITRLDNEGFDQRKIATLAADPLWSGRKLHIFNRAGDLEVIDGSAWGRKF